MLISPVVKNEVLRSAKMILCLGGGHGKDIIRSGKFCPNRNHAFNSELIQYQHAVLLATWRYLTGRPVAGT